MKEWARRPVEIANLLNPAFCGALVGQSVEAYSKEKSEGMPLLFAYLVLPLVLHQESRNSLPNRINTSFVNWAEQNRSQLVGLRNSYARLSPYTQEAILFDFVHSVLTFDELGMLRYTEGSLVQSSSGDRKFTYEVNDCLKRSAFLGRWLARAGTEVTVFSFLGVL